MDLTIISILAQTDVASAEAMGSDAGKALALGLAGGLAALGTAIGTGFIFGKTIDSTARQPEQADELRSIMLLGFALTEACVFYGLVAGLLAFFL